MKKVFLILGLVSILVAGCGKEAKEVPTKAVETIPENPELNDAPAEAAVVEPVKEVYITAEEKPEVENYILEIGIIVTGFNQSVKEFDNAISDPYSASSMEVLKIHENIGQMFDNLEFSPVPEVENKEVNELLSDLDTNLHLAISSLSSSSLMMALALETGNFDGVKDIQEMTENGSEYMRAFQANIEEMKKYAN